MHDYAKEPQFETYRENYMKYKKQFNTVILQNANLTAKSSIELEMTENSQIKSAASYLILQQ